MIIYLNGPINAGKTTIAQGLQKKLPTLVHIEVDDLRHFASFITMDQIIPFILEDTRMLTRSWVERSYNVVVTWPLTPNQFERFKQLADQLNTSLFGFTLLPDMATCLQDRGDRQLSDVERQRISELYQTLYIGKQIGEVIDTGVWTPAQTTEYILQFINDDHTQ